MRKAILKTLRYLVIVLVVRNEIILARLHAYEKNWLEC